MACADVDESIRVAAVFRTLSDPFRLHMFAVVRDLCLEHGSLDAKVELAEAVDETSRALNMSPNLAERHLLELARAGVIVMDEGVQGRPLLALNVGLMKDVARLVEGAGPGGARAG